MDAQEILKKFSDSYNQENVYAKIYEVEVLIFDPLTKAKKKNLANLLKGEGIRAFRIVDALYKEDSCLFGCRKGKKALLIELQDLVVFRRIKLVDSTAFFFLYR